LRRLGRRPIASRSGAAPLVSIVVPAHNAEATLARTLSSALASTFGDFELLVIDDGSTDGTAAVAEKFARSDNRVRLHRRRQGGVSAALNTGVQHARGTYVARLDSDDLWHATKLEKQVAMMFADPALALVYTDVRYIDAQDRIIRDVAPQRLQHRALSRMVHSGLVGGNSSVLMRRSAVVAAGGYDEALRSWEDLLLYISICAEHPIGAVPEYLVGYRVRPESLSADPQNMLDSWAIARRKIERRFRHVPRFVHRWGHARRTVELAEGFAWKGRYGTCVRLLVDAMIHDPVWTSRFLSYRIRRRFSGGSQPLASDTRRFEECAVSEPCRLSRFDRGLEGRSLRRLERKRAGALDSVDQRRGSPTSLSNFRTQRRKSETGAGK